MNLAALMMYFRFMMCVLIAVPLFVSLGCDSEPTVIKADAEFKNQIEEGKRQRKEEGPKEAGKE